MDESEEFAKFTQSLFTEQSAAETPAPEAPKEDAPAEVKADKPAEPPRPEEKKEEKPVDWKALADKEKERRAQRAASKLQSARIEKELVEAKAKAAQLDEIMKLSKEKRLSALEKLGMTLDDVNGEYIRDLEENPNKAPPQLVAAEKRIAQLEAKLDAVLQKDEQTKAESAKREAEAARAKIQSEYETRASEAIKAKSDEYEILAKHPKGSEVVFHFIAAHYANTATFDEQGNLIVPGEELEVSEACRRVETKLVEQYGWTGEVKKLRGSSKAQDSATLAGDVRQAAPPTETAADDDKEFLNTTLRLIKQQPG